MSHDYDITNDLDSGRNDPWDTLDEAMCLVRDACAAVGICAVLGGIVGYLWVVL